MSEVLLPSIEELLLARHPLPEWAAFREVAQRPGYDAQRVDVAAFNVYPSRKGVRVAYEVKRSRRDFLAELDRPDKRFWAEQQFHETYFAVARDVCTPEEVPTGWGLLVLTKAGDKLRRAKVATHRAVGPLSEGVALHLLRRVLTDVQQFTTHRWLLDGKAVTWAELERTAADLAHRRVEIAQRHAVRQVAALRRAGKAFTDAKYHLTEPLAELARLADRPFAARTASPAMLTRAHVRRWAARASRRRVAAVEEALQTLQHQAAAALAVLGDDAGSSTDR